MSEPSNATGALRVRAPWIAAVAVGVVALVAGLVLHLEARLPEVRLDQPLAPGVTRVAGWVQPGGGLDDGLGFLAVQWRGPRPRLGTWVIASGRREGARLIDAEASAAWLSPPRPAPAVSDRVGHLARGLTLPRSRQPPVLREAPIVTLAPDATSLEGRLLADGGAELPPETFEAALREHLAARGGPSTGGLVLVAADERVAAERLLAVLRGAAAVGATEWGLVVADASGPGAILSSLPQRCTGAPDGSCLPTTELRDPWADLPGDDGAWLEALQLELAELPAGLDPAGALAEVEALPALRRCLMEMGDEPRVVKLAARFGPVLPGLPARRAVDQLRFQRGGTLPEREQQCVIAELGRLVVPIVADVPEEARRLPLDGWLSLLAVPRGRLERGEAYGRERGKRAPFTEAPWFMLEAERLLVATPYDLPEEVRKLGTPAGVGGRRERLPLAIARGEDPIVSFGALRAAVGMLASMRPEAEWPVLLVPRGTSVADVARALEAIRGECRTLLCPNRRGGFRAVVLQLDEP